MKVKNSPYKSTSDLKEKLFRAYAKQLFNYALKSWKIDEDEAWQLIYHTLEKVEDKWEELSFQHEKQLKAYLFKTYINLLKNLLQARHQKPAISIDEVELMAEEAQSKPSEKVQKLSELLDELEDWQRILLLLRAQEFSYKEIENYVDKPAKTLKVYYGRLKKQLSEKLKQTYHGE